MLFHVLGHIQPDHGALVVKQKLGESARQFGFADSCWSEKNKRPDRPVRIGESRAVAANGIRNALERIFLAHDALTQPLFHLDELPSLAFEQPAYRNSGPFADQRGDIFLVDLFFQHAAIFLHLNKPFLRFVKLALRLRQFAIANLRHFGQITRSFVTLLFRLQRIDLLFLLANRGDGVFFHLPASLAGVSLFTQFGELLIELHQAFARMFVGLLEQCLPFDFELHDAPLDLVDLDRQRIQLHAQRRRRFIDQVDRLIGQEAVGDVAVRKRGRRNNCGIFDANPVMQFVTVFQPAQNCDRVFYRRLRDQHRLESPFQRWILFDVLPVLVDGRGADRA